MSKFVVFGKLRRETIILGSFDSVSDATKLAEDAVREGRASETFVIAASAAFSESNINFANPDAARASIPVAPARSVPLNPNAGEQPAEPDPELLTQDVVPAPRQGASTPEKYPEPGHVVEHKEDEKSEKKSDKKS